MLVLSPRPVTRALAVAFWTGTLWFALWAFTPERTAIESFNSDDAISVLMANEHRITPFHLYYFGQDRFGGWPHLALALASRWFGPITPRAFSHAQVLWAWLGALPLWYLAGPHAPGALVAYLAALALAPPLTIHLLSASQPYSWQIGALLWAWWALRKLVSARRRTATIMTIAFSFALLAAWASRASVPMVVALAALEALRDRAARGGFHKPHFLAMAVAAGAGLSEAGLRALHTHYSRVHFGRDYRTAIHFDFVFLPQNLRAVIHKVIELPPGSVSLVAIAVGLAALVLWAFARVRNRQPSAWEEGALLAGAFAILAAIQLTFCIATNWARINDYSPRYFVFSILFACLTIGVVASWVATSALPAAGSLLLLFGAGLFLAFRPSPSHAAEFEIAQSTARALSHARPRSILWGDYWATYRLAAAVPEARLRPLPFADEYDRMPWVRRDFAVSDLIVAVFGNTDRLGTPSEPAAILVDGGEILEFAGTAFQTTLPLALYRRRTQARPAVHVEGGDEERALFDGRFETSSPLRELTLRYRCAGGSTLDVLGADAAAQIWQGEGWVPLGGNRHFGVPASSQGDVRVRLVGRGTAREVIALCDG